MGKKPQMIGRDGGLFPVRFDIDVESERQTKQVQGLFKVQGDNKNLLEVRKEIYERGLKTFQHELRKFKAMQIDV